jgi:hypothetical protein
MCPLNGFSQDAARFADVDRAVMREIQLEDAVAMLGEIKIQLANIAKSLDGSRPYDVPGACFAIQYLAGVPIQRVDRKKSDADSL